MNIELLLEMQKELGVISAHMQEVKIDLRDHMKRTAILETEIKFLHKQAYILYGIVIATAALIKFTIGS